jgi:hypothetical protein
MSSTTVDGETASLDVALVASMVAVVAIAFVLSYTMVWAVADGGRFSGSGGKATLKRYRLPNEREVVSVNDYETGFLYDEIFTSNAYGSSACLRVGGVCVWGGARGRSEGSA